MEFVVASHANAFSIPPLPEQCLFFYPKDRSISEVISSKKSEFLSASAVTGPNTARHRITPGCNHLMIKVGFQPGGLYRLLGIPMSELLYADAFDAVDLLGSEMAEVNDKLQYALSFGDMKIIVENFLFTRLGKLKKGLPIDRVLPVIIKERGLIKIDQLASSACLSIRQFERVFQQRIGLPPKHFSRLVRFSNAWILKQQHSDISWMRIAYDCGYFDQMHLVRDFHEFADVNPSSIETELLNSPVKFFNRLFL